MQLEIFNSYCQLTGKVPEPVKDLVTELLSYENDIAAEKARLFYTINSQAKNSPRRIAALKALKVLEDSQYVCFFNNNKFPTGHVNIVKKGLEALKVRYEELDHRVKPGIDGIFKWYNKPFEPRYYQQEAIDLSLKEGRGVIEAAVGSGKSLIAAYILKGLAVNSLIVVPSTGLSLQLYNDFKVWFGPHMVEIVNTAKVRKGKQMAPIRIITIQSMASLNRTGELHGLVHDINAIFIDEIHHAGSKSYLELLNSIEHIYYRFGFSGTFMRNDSKFLDMWGFLSNVLYRYPAHKATQDKFLTPIEVLTYKLEGRTGKGGKKVKSYIKEYQNNYCGNPDMMQKIAEICLQNPKDQILILVKNKDKSGKLMHEYFKIHGIENTYISGDDSKETIVGSITDFNNKDARILIGSAVIGEGIDIRSTDHLIMAQGGKSEIAIVQAIGRLVRLFAGKTIGYLHDFDFTNTNYMGKHFKQRMDIVKRTFSPKEIKEC